MTSLLVMKNWREHGELCNERGTEVLRVDHPSERSIIEQIEQLNWEIQGIRSFGSGSWQMAELQGFLDELESFREAQMYNFGYVWAASGFKMKKRTHITRGAGTILDWALVKFPSDRKGTNKVRTLVTMDY